ncbi:MAG: hypothetical protein HY581_02835 [Nitrospirae bacterium]|nr:hypothetical protein [Nitrospirota bacterium]
MRLVSGLMVGFLSGFLICLMFAMIFASGVPSSWLVAATLLGGWAITSYFVLRGTASTGEVWARGGLIGAAEWLCVATVALIFGAKIAVQLGAVMPTEAARTGVALGAGLLSMIGGGISVVMAIVCLIMHFMATQGMGEVGRLFSRRPCPYCAELIKPDARLCRFCGREVASKAA